MKNKLFKICFFLTLSGLLLIAPAHRALANSEWDLQITTLSGTTVNFSYDQLLAIPMTTVSAALVCFGNPVTSGDWSGVSLSFLLQNAGVDPAVASIDFLAQDGYMVSIPLQIALQPNVIIAYEQDGSPLSQKLRLVLPGENGGLWIALITSITMDTVTIDSNQFLVSNAMGPNQLESMHSIGQSATQQQAPIQAQPTASPKNDTKTEIIAPPANITQSDQKTIPQQNSSPKNLAFPVAVEYGIAFGATIALVTASYLAFSQRRKGKK